MGEVDTIEMGSSDAELVDEDSVTEWLGHQVGNKLAGWR